MDTILYIVILLTGFYMAWNIGANDVANAMGTSVGSGALSLRRAVIIAAILEFCGAFFFGSHVSQTMQSGIINPNYFINDPRTLVYGMLAALASTGIWLQLASYYGWPVSTTHSIVGAIVGFGAVVGGVDAIYWGNIGFIISSWILSPCLGGVIGYSLFVLLRKQIFYKPNPIYAAKRLTPLLVFILITILMIIFLSEEMSTIYLKISFNQKILLTIFVGLIGAITSWFLIRHIRPSTVRESHPAIISEMNYSLNKARKHLKKVQGLGDLATHSQIDSLIQEVEGLSSSLRQKETLAEGHSEYLEVEKIFGYLQIVTACMMAFAHGANDVANAIGPLSAAIGILSTGIFSTHTSIPTWALALGGTGIVVGLATWGWRVIETIGKKITELTPTRGFSAEFGAATTIVCASYFGMPISTTHTLVGAIVGVGFARGLEAINLTTTRDILISWVITVPVGAIIAIILFYPIRAIFG